MESVLSVILGIFIGIFVGIFYAFRAVFLLLRYWIGGLIGLLLPKKKYRIRAKWLTRRVKKDGKICTGAVSKRDFHGSELEGIFVRLSDLLEKEKEQRRLRKSMISGENITDMFARIDGLFDAYLKQFVIYTRTIDWEQASKPNTAYSDKAKTALRDCLSKMELLLNKHNDLVQSTSLGSVDDQINLHTMEEELETVSTFIDYQQQNIVPEHVQQVSQEDDGQSGMPMQQ